MTGGLFLLSCTSRALGEEGPPQPPQPTTRAVGEEQPEFTTLAIGEESSPFGRY